LRAVLQIFFSVALFSSVVFANNFKDIRIISLKKDEQKKILVKYGSVKKLFKFRWTLYKNKGLVVLRSYDRIVAQNVLYIRERNQSFRVELKPKGADFYQVPYLLVKFKEFDFEKNVAVFGLYLSDRKEQVQLEDLDKKQKRD
jgi:hypothetical protein